MKRKSLKLLQRVAAHQKVESPNKSLKEVFKNLVINQLPPQKLLNLRLRNSSLAREF